MISENIHRIRQNLPEGVRLVTVSKYRTKEELMEAYAAGERLFAENRPLELFDKANSLPKDIHWHFIGHLQTNKLKYVVPVCEMVQSVDSVHLLDAIEKYCAEKNLNIKALLEVHVAREETKQGFSCEEILQMAKTGSLFENAWPHISICGLMGMASHTDDSVRIEQDFALLKSLFDEIRGSHPEQTQFCELSMGMSADYLLAVKHGSTMVRIGSVIFE